jgi:hypothetical protein
MKMFQKWEKTNKILKLADSVMLRDTLYANIGETVELRCPYTSHALQLQ